MKRTLNKLGWASLGVLVATVSVLAAPPPPMVVTGTADQKTKMAGWLTKALQTDVTIKADGTLDVAPGGNASATELRNMTTDTSVRAAVQLCDDIKNMSMDGWIPTDLNNPAGPTRGVQGVDMHDLDGIGNIDNDFGMTPGTKLMHAITELYWGVKNGLSYPDAHKKAEEAEARLMAIYGTAWVGQRYFTQNGMRYMKIKRSDSYVVVGFVPKLKGQKCLWYREIEVCKSAEGLVHIPDPDPQVHRYQYDFGLNHTPLPGWDTLNSSPRGAGVGPQGNLYVSEDLAGQDEIRIFDKTGSVIGNITGPQLVSPHGLEVDHLSGDVFVAAQGQVLRHGSDGALLGAYGGGIAGFNPSDVSIMREDLAEGLEIEDPMYDIFATDKASGQVYRFDVMADMNQPTYRAAFGAGQLSDPEGLKIDPETLAVWVASTGNHSIYRFDMAGNCLDAGPWVQDLSRVYYDLDLTTEGAYVVDHNGVLLLYSHGGQLVNTYAAGQCPYSVTMSFNFKPNNLEEIQIPEPAALCLLTGCAAVMVRRTRR